MTVAELIAKLREMPQDATVLYNDNEYGWLRLPEIPCFPAEGYRFSNGHIYEDNLDEPSARKETVVLLG